MWFASERRLLRWDGNSTKNYAATLHNKSGFVGGMTQCMFVDSKKNLWVGAANGAQIYNEAKDRFSSEIYPCIDGRSGFWVSSIAEDQYGNIWFATNQIGLVIYNPNDHTTQKVTLVGDKQSSLPYTLKELLLTDNFINETPGKLLWVGTTNGIRCLLLNEGNYKPIDLSKVVKETEHLDGVDITSLATDNTHDLWIGTSTGLYQLSYEQKQSNPFYFRIEMRKPHTKYYH